MIRWLHISDLHLGSSDMTTEMLRDELPEYLRKANLRCDYQIFKSYAYPVYRRPE